MIGRISATAYYYRSPTAHILLCRIRCGAGFDIARSCALNRGAHTTAVTMLIAHISKEHDVSEFSLFVTNYVSRRSHATIVGDSAIANNLCHNLNGWEWLA
jgi:hypothetical protein